MAAFSTDSGHGDHHRVAGRRKPTVERLAVTDPGLGRAYVVHVRHVDDDAVRSTGRPEPVALSSRSRCACCATLDRIVVPAACGATAAGSGQPAAAGASETVCGVISVGTPGMPMVSDAVCADSAMVAAVSGRQAPVLQQPETAGAVINPTHTHRPQSTHTFNLEPPRMPEDCETPVSPRHYEAKG
jgi:hypothetical protein